ncbi:hypothetical protein NTG1052_170030 [Candidatus Nitrotoga sp. 1052]|nr:hypothetical protein NTG1052_170030 [Candidatus Nitrotoga sp. 1052]
MNMTNHSAHTISKVPAKIYSVADVTVGKITGLQMLIPRSRKPLAFVTFCLHQG